MVTDFGNVKSKLKDYIDNWDHFCVLPNTLPKEYLDMIAKYNKRFRVLDYNPTAELMSKQMYEDIKKMVPQLSKVILWETTTGCAEYYE